MHSIRYATKPTQQPRSPATPAGTTQLIRIFIDYKLTKLIQVISGEPMLYSYLWVISYTSKICERKKYYIVGCNGRGFFTNNWTSYKVTLRRFVYSGSHFSPANLILIEGSGIVLKRCDIFWVSCFYHEHMQKMCQCRSICWCEKFSYFTYRDSLTLIPSRVISLCCMELSIL